MGGKRGGREGGHAYRRGALVEDAVRAAEGAGGRALSGPRGLGRERQAGSTVDTTSGAVMEADVRASHAATFDVHQAV